MVLGVVPKDLADHSERFGAIPFKREVVCVAGTATYNVFPQGFERGGRVLGFTGIMTGAGAAGDTVRLAAVDRDTGSATNITEAIDLSALSDNDAFAAGSIDDTARSLKQGDYLRVTTASGATCTVYIEILPHQETA